MADASSSSTDAPKKRLAFIPLESNPEVFNSLAYKLGLSSQLSFCDVYSLTDDDLLAFVPRPVYALILVFPVSENYEKMKSAEDAGVTDYDGSGEDESVVWFKQTIRNACGMMGLLHAVVNGEQADYIEEGSHLKSLLSSAIPLKPLERTHLLETSSDLAVAHEAAGKSGQTEAPNPEDNVEHHFIAFIKSKKDGHIYELDGSRKGPLDRGQLEKDDDMLSQKARDVIKGCLDREGGQNLNFGLMALVKGGAD